MRTHHYTTGYGGEALEKAVGSLANTSFTLLLSSRIIRSTMNGSEIRAGSFIMRARGSFRPTASGSTVHIRYRFSRTLLIYPPSFLFMLVVALFGNFKNVGEIGIVWERILAVGVVLFTGLIFWRMAFAHRRSFIRRIEEGLKLNPAR